MERIGSTGSRALFPKGPSFSLEDFSNKDFIVRDFVDTLAETAVPPNRRSGVATATATATTNTTTTATSTTSGQQQAFDPKPLIRTFENALSQLATLTEELEEKESDILSQVRRAEIQHDQTLDTLGHKLDQSMAQFEALDLSLNHPEGGGGGGGGRNGRSDTNGRTDPNGGNIAVQIGEKLEELDRKRRRALDAMFLVQCWTELSETGQLTSLESIQRQGGAENKVRCAVITRQLMRISQRLDPGSWGNGRGGGGGPRGTRDAKSNGNGLNGPNETRSNGSTSPTTQKHNTREVMEKFSETLEQDLLKQFNNSYRRQNFDDMLECAKVLHDFNGGTSVIAAFVNQHQFFIDRDQLLTDEVTTDGAMWNQLADPDAEPPGVEPSLQSLIDEVKIVMQEESFIIKRAFPYYEPVLIKFIQRVFQQSIQQRLEMVLEKASTVSTLAYLRSLHASRSYIGALVEDLKTHGLTEHPEPCSTQIAQTLDQQVEELFVPYLVGSSYMDKETKSLEELFNAVLFKFTTFHSRRPKATRGGFMNMLTQQGTQLLASAKDAYMERLASSDLTVTQKAMMLRVAGIQDSDSSDNNSDVTDRKNEIEVTDEDGVLRVATAKRMLRWLAESVRRTLELGTAAETPKEVSALLHLLLATVGQVYMETALDAAQDQAAALESSSNKTEPDLQSYLPQAVRPAVTITSLLARFIQTVLIRLAEGNPTVRRSMEAQTRMGIDAIEKKTNLVLRTTIDVVAVWSAKLLATTQKRTDFRPRDSDLEDVVETLQTPTCEALCAFWDRVIVALRQAVDPGNGHNLEAVTAELARVLCQQLLDHFKKFAVNATGGLMVTKDLAKYVSTLKAWPLTKDAEATVDVLTEVGYLFIIGPEALRERSRNLALAGTVAGGKRLQKADFKAFVQKRDDASTVGVQSVLASL